MKKYFCLLVLLPLCGCRTAHEMQISRVEKTDSTSVTQARYDSVFVGHERSVERLSDTLRITDKVVEYRYKWLRDTVRIVLREVQQDSIPYPVVQVQEVERPLGWFDRLVRAVFWAVCGLILAAVCRKWFC